MAVFRKRDVTVNLFRSAGLGMAADRHINSPLAFLLSISASEVLDSFTYIAKGGHTIYRQCR
jgi:hypothetical protein